MPVAWLVRCIGRPPRTVAKFPVAANPTVSMTVMVEVHIAPLLISVAPLPALHVAARGASHRYRGHIVRPPVTRIGCVRAIRRCRKSNCTGCPRRKGCRSTGGLSSTAYARGGAGPKTTRTRLGVSCGEGHQQGEGGGGARRVLHVAGARRARERPCAPGASTGAHGTTTPETVKDFAMPVASGGAALKALVCVRLLDGAVRRRYVGDLRCRGAGTGSRPRRSRGAPPPRRRRRRGGRWG